VASLLSGLISPVLQLVALQGGRDNREGEQRQLAGQLAVALPVICAWDTSVASTCCTPSHNPGWLTLEVTADSVASVKHEATTSVLPG
jgi:hypothetical protein